MKLTDRGRMYEIAQAWLDAWNRHDINAIVGHYADDIIFTSPFVGEIMGDPTCTVRGKDAVRAYFERGLAAHPDLHFTDLRVFAGIGSMVLNYRRAGGPDAAEVMVLDDAGLVTRVRAHYEKPPL